MSVRLTAIICGVLLLGSASGRVALGQTGGHAKEEAAIRELDAAWSHAAETKDLEKTVSYYAEDGSILPYNAPIATGKENVKAVWSHLMSLPGFGLTFAPTKIDVSKTGDLAYDVGTFALKANDAQGNAATTVGKYVVVWKKQKSGEWKVEADIFNTDK